MSSPIPILNRLEAKLAVAYVMAASDGIHLPEEFDAVNRMLGHRFAAGEESLTEQRQAHRRVTRVLEGSEPTMVMEGVRRALQGADDERVEALALALTIAQADGEVDHREADSFQALVEALEAGDDEVERAWYRVAGAHEDEPSARP